MRQALISAVVEHGTPDTWFNADMTENEATEIFVNNVKPYLNVTRTCKLNMPGGVNSKEKCGSARVPLGRVYGYIFGRWCYLVCIC